MLLSAKEALLPKLKIEHFSSEILGTWNKYLTFVAKNNKFKLNAQTLLTKIKR
jgi:hypothetical protein